MMQEQDDPSIKKQFVFDNIKKLPEIYQKDAEQVIASLIHTFPQIVKLDTFYKTLKPLIFSYTFEEPHTEVQYPLATVIAFPHSDQPYCSVNLRFASWVESGGVRCIPLKSTGNQKEIQKICSMTHCAIVPEWVGPDPQNTTEFFTMLLHEFHTNNALPMFFIGRSAIKALGLLLQTELVSFGNEGMLAQVFISHSSHLLRDLTLPSRLCLENRKKITTPSGNIKPSALQSSPGFTVTAVMLGKNGEETVLLIQNNERKLYFLLAQPHTSENPESIAFYHKIIVNLVDVARSKKKIVNEKQIEKVLLATHKIVMKGEEAKGHYKLI